MVLENSKEPLNPSASFTHLIHEKIVFSSRPMVGAVNGTATKAD